MDDEDLLSAVIDSIYATTLAADPRAAWLDCMSLIERRFDGAQAMLFLQDDRGARVSFMHAPSFDPSFIDLYAQHYGAINPWTAAVNDPAHRPGSLHRTEELIDEAVLVKTEFFNGWVRPQAIHRGFGSILLKEPDRVMGLSVVTPEQRGFASDRDLKFIARLVPHLQRAAEIHRHLGHLEAERVTVARAFDSLSVGVIILSEQGTVLSFNRSADGILRAADGLTKTSRGLAAAFRTDDAALQRALAERAGASLSIGRPSGKQPYFLTLIPISIPERLKLDVESPRAMILISSAERKVGPAEAQLTTLFGLTRAEARVARLLAAGRRPAEIRDQLGIAMPTVRSQIRAVLEKTGTNRMAELIAILSALPTEVAAT